MLQAQETVNGYPVLAWIPTKDETAVVLVKRPLRGEPFVTACVSAVTLLSPPGGQWYWGHYFQDEAQALADLFQRSERALAAACG